MLALKNGGKKTRMAATAWVQRRACELMFYLLWQIRLAALPLYPIASRGICLCPLITPLEMENELRGSRLV